MKNGYPQIHIFENVALAEATRKTNQFIFDKMGERIPCEVLNVIPKNNMWTVVVVSYEKF